MPVQRDVVFGQSNPQLDAVGLLRNGLLQAPDVIGEAGVGVRQCRQNRLGRFRYVGLCLDACPLYPPAAADHRPWCLCALPIALTNIAQSLL